MKTSYLQIYHNKISLLLHFRVTEPHLNSAELLLFSAMVIGCRDDHPQCRQWSLVGECTNNPNYMLEKCKESCNICRRLNPKESPSKFYCIELIENTHILCSWSKLEFKQTHQIKVIIV